jgi:competence ComEA-like helix-hairpin-helix protein
VNLDRSSVKPVQFAIDINEADWPEFALLPRIGPAQAQSIVELRERLGRFRHHDELLKVKGIGPKTMAAIKPYLLPIETEPEVTMLEPRRKIQPPSRGAEPRGSGTRQAAGKE